MYKFSKDNGGDALATDKSLKKTNGK